MRSSEAAVRPARPSSSQFVPDAVCECVRASYRDADAHTDTRDPVCASHRDEHRASAEGMVNPRRSEGLEALAPTHLHPTPPMTPLDACAREFSCSGLAPLVALATIYAARITRPRIATPEEIAQREQAEEGRRRGRLALAIPCEPCGKAAGEPCAVLPRHLGGPRGRLCGHRVRAAMAAAADGAVSQ